MSEDATLYQVRIVFRQALTAGLAVLDVRMTAAERERLCQDIASTPTEHVDSHTGHVHTATRGGTYEIHFEGKSRRLALQFADVLYVS